MDKSVVRVEAAWDCVLCGCSIMKDDANGCFEFKFSNEVYDCVSVC